MLVNSIKIGIVAGALAVATFTVTTPETQTTNTQVRIPDSIDQGSPASLQMYNYIKQYADTFDIPLRYAFGIANTETGYNGPFNSISNGYSAVLISNSVESITATPVIITFNQAGLCRGVYKNGSTLVITVSGLYKIGFRVNGAATGGVGFLIYINNSL